MVLFGLNIKTCCLHVIWESKIKFGQKFFASPKIFTPVHLCDNPPRQVKISVMLSNTIAQNIMHFCNAMYAEQIQCQEIKNSSLWISKLV